MMTAVSSALTTLVSSIGTVITAITSETGALKELLPLFAIGVGIALFGACIRMIKSVVWGA